MSVTATHKRVSSLSLPDDRSILIERTFNAPRELLWRAFTEASLLPQWMGPARYTMTTSTMDVRPGGTYRWVWKLDEGELVITGRFVELDPPRRMVTLEVMGEFTDPKDASHNTLTFTEKGGETMVSILMKLPSTQIRDAVVATGMKEGMDQGYLRLDGLLKQLA